MVGEGLNISFQSEGCGGFFVCLSVCPSPLYYYCSLKLMGYAGSLPSFSEARIHKWESDGEGDLMIREKRNHKLPGDDQESKKPNPQANLLVFSFFLARGGERGEASVDDDDLRANLRVQLCLWFLDSRWFPWVLWKISLCQFRDWSGGYEEISLGLYIFSLCLVELLVGLKHWSGSD